MCCATDRAAADATLLEESHMGRVLGGHYLLLVALVLAPEVAESQGANPKTAVAKDTTVARAEMLARVDRRILAERHKLDPKLLSTFTQQVLLSIDAVSPASPKEGDQLTVQYTLTNLTLEVAGGAVTGSFQSKALTGANGAKPGNVNLAPGQSVSGTLRAPGAAITGQATMKLAYRDKETCRRMPGPVPGTTRDVCTAKWTASASSDVTVIRDVAKIDDDADGIPDIVEQTLLARFRPYYRFSKSVVGTKEPYHPADVVTVVRGSDLYDYKTEAGSNPVVSKTALSGTPLLVLSATSKGPSNVALSPHKSDYYLNIANVLHGGEPDWTRIQNEATGLYGHVAPLRDNTNGKVTGYKIEYWQFYAFNPAQSEIDCTIATAIAHEGDWEGVELVIEPDLKTVRSVRHHVHDKDVVFELTLGKPVDIGNGFLEYQGTGPNRPHAALIDLIADGPAGIGWAQNNLVRFFCNVDGCTHPVVYIEHGGHASWPTEHWVYSGTPLHRGDERSFLVATPSNLGEIGHPMPGCVGCQLVLGYNGRWGACGDPPEGPPLKGSWGKPE